MSCESFRMSQYLQAHSWTRIKQMAKRRKRRGREKIKKTTTTTSTFTRKKRFGFRCLSTILFVELRRVCFRSASTSDGHLDHLAPGRERPYSPGKCQGRNESCISLVSAARSLHSPSVIIIRVSYEQLKCSLFVAVSQYLIHGKFYSGSLKSEIWTGPHWSSCHLISIVSSPNFRPKLGNSFCQKSVLLHHIASDSRTLTSLQPLHSCGITSTFAWSFVRVSSY